MNAKQIIKEAKRKARETMNKNNLKYMLNSKNAKTHAAYFNLIEGTKQK